ncbi:hypothetical protein BJY04DRAFT_107900 [Aspergillus karnatakaensis]|uniref:uncharacterized protein n=1 Tax=Aspergillus karnatakaensis TaxID=1810916 RepID=UPI003CCD838E
MCSNVITCPTIIDVCRYVRSLAKVAKPNCEGKVMPNSSTIGRYTKRTLSILSFNSPDEFIVTDAHMTRLRKTIKDLATKGKVTKGRWFPHQRAGFYIVRQILRVWFVDHRNHGTTSWDKTISIALGLALQYALGCRSGELARSNGYTGTEYLAWGDIELTLKVTDRPASVQDFVLRYLARALKDQKDKMNHNHDPFLAAFPYRVDNLTCPVELALALALRTGQAPGNSVDEVLRNTAKRPDHTVQWKNPDLPVLCAFKTHGDYSFDSTQPASVTSQIRRMKQLVGTARLRIRVTPRHLEEVLYRICLISQPNLPA